jgi:hypothetical protein
LKKKKPQYLAAMLHAFFLPKHMQICHGGDQLRPVLMPSAYLNQHADSDILSFLNAVFTPNSPLKDGDRNFSYETLSSLRESSDQQSPHKINQSLRALSNHFEYPGKQSETFLIKIRLDIN